MKNTKRLGIYMDHFNAHLMDISTGEHVSTMIESGFTPAEKESTIHEGESRMHNAEQHLSKAYYKKLGDVIKAHDEVVLFGPTKAKDELHNFLTADHLFSKIDIAVKHSDKLTENQQHAFVRDYFRTKL